MLCNLSNNLNLAAMLIISARGVSLTCKSLTPKQLAWAMGLSSEVAFLHTTLQLKTINRLSQDPGKPHLTTKTAHNLVYCFNKLKYIRSLILLTRECDLVCVGWIISKLCHDKLPPRVLKVVDDWN
eukprot:Blabericola_migrator_1__2658@NODE_1754_length_3853_cov_6_641310_g1131_i0_p4_GENE_NODE_1754_length_3853_cov_6_641310_g1131_i0NODE_1754_length_3853_cov_6_641310_g1131_i0_p4_ORF_typecomplete_len126_score17_82_NODE_1754_length_3853_cov_6_641310_g1131_i06511028